MYRHPVTHSIHVTHPSLISALFIEITWNDFQILPEGLCKYYVVRVEKFCHMLTIYDKWGGRSEPYWLRKVNPKRRLYRFFKLCVFLAILILFLHMSLVFFKDSCYTFTDIIKGMFIIEEELVDLPLAVSIYPEWNHGVIDSN